MWYRAYLIGSGEILECDSFRNVYHFSMDHAKWDARKSKEVQIIRIYRCAAEDVPFMSEAEDPVCMIAVGVTGYTIDYNGVVLSVDRDVWSVEV